MKIELMFRKHTCGSYCKIQVKGFLDQISLHWNTNNDNILRIMQHHAAYRERFVIIFAGFCYPSVCMIMIYHVSPIVMDKISPINESRPVRFPIEYKSFLGDEERPYLTTFMLYLAVIVDVTVFIGAESLIILIVSHIAGLFEIASYHFQKAILEESSALCPPRDCINYKNISYIISGVAIHRMALQFVHDFNDHCKISFVPAILFGVIALSSHLFCLSETVRDLSDVRETILSVLLLTSTLGYMFWMNIAFQYMIDSADSISLLTYNTNWYETSTATQKMLQLIILYSNKDLSFKFLSIYVPSANGFAVVCLILRLGFNIIFYIESLLFSF
ncbi:uncharacterized protein LOC143264860 [Megachile rotundata]|uniref:uncharacterized protein LOC143264860 n=1 Tax=Megachile rotundata TaxID=143995 RepID=UPI003FD121AC